MSDNQEKNGVQKVINTVEKTIESEVNKVKLFIGPQTLPSDVCEPYSREVLLAVLTTPQHPSTKDVKLPQPPHKIEKKKAIFGLEVPAEDDTFKYLPEWELLFQKLMNNVSGEIDFNSQWKDKEEIDKVFAEHINQYLPERRVNWGDITTDENTARFIFQGPGFMKIQPFSNYEDTALSTLYPQVYPTLQRPTYKADYSFLKQFNVMPGLENHGCVAYFSGDIYPKLLFIQNDNKLYINNDNVSTINTSNEWEYQKYVLRSAAMIYGTVFEHAGFTHLSIANSCNIAAKETLSENHILRRLLQIFTCGSAQINLAAAYLLLPEENGGFSRKGLGNDCVKNILKHGFENFEWKTFPQHIFDAGLSQSTLPIVVDGIQVWNIIEDFINKFIDSYIECQNDQILDNKIVEFWGEIRNHIPLKNNIPELVTKPILKEYLTKMIFNAIAFHTHIGEAAEYFSPYVYSWALKKDIACAPKMTLGIDFWVVMGTGTKSPMLLDNWDHMFSGDSMCDYGKQLFNDFQEELRMLAEKIDFLNTTRDWRFRNFNPRYFLSSVSI
jgi:hypothetical protein